jgi:hypothetical protein
MRSVRHGVVCVAAFVVGCAAPCPPSADVRPARTIAKVAPMAAAGAAPAAIPEEAMAEAVRQAREQASAIDPDKAPLAYVRTFESALRPRVEALTGREVAPLAFDERPTALPLYQHMAAMIQSSNGKVIYVGDQQKGAERRDAVSMLTGREQCTAIVIAKNAIATAKHCLQGSPKSIRIGPSKDNGKLVEFDSTKFVPVKDIHGVELDMAILILPEPIKELRNDELPVFASTAMIDSATQWRPVGYGGVREDHTEPGVKRMGAVSKLDSDCSGPDIAATYDCTPGYEIVAGPPTMFGATTCSGLADEQFGACRGDSGGPVYLESNGRLFLAAMIRWVDPKGCGCKQATNVYVRFDKQLEAIRKMKGIDFAPEAFAEFDKQASLIGGARASSLRAWIESTNDE